MLKTLLVVAALIGVTVPAVAQSYNGRDEPCLRNRNIYDYQVVPGDRSLVVRDIARKGTGSTSWASATASSTIWAWPSAPAAPAPCPA